jgi:SsrA-binding protein
MAGRAKDEPRALASNKRARHDFLVGAHISPYSHGNRENHPPERSRRLLLSRREIDRLYGKAQLQGLTIVPLSVYLKGNWIKLEIALAQGKKLYDKRETEREREADREVAAAVKDRRGAYSPPASWRR